MGQGAGAVISEIEESSCKCTSPSLHCICTSIRTRLPVLLLTQVQLGLVLCWYEKRMGKAVLSVMPVVV